MFIIMQHKIIEIFLRPLLGISVIRDREINKGFNNSINYNVYRGISGCICVGKTGSSVLPLISDVAAGSRFLCTDACF